MGKMKYIYIYIYIHICIYDQIVIKIQNRRKDGCQTNFYPSYQRTSKHTDDREKNLFDTLYRTPPFRARFVTHWVITGRVQNWYTYSAICVNCMHVKHTVKNVTLRTSYLLRQVGLCSLPICQRLNQFCSTKLGTLMETKMITGIIIRFRNIVKWLNVIIAHDNRFCYWLIYINAYAWWVLEASSVTNKQD